MKSMRERLYELQDKKYCDFQSSLCPTVERQTMIGVRTPALKNLAKEMIRNKEEQTFLKELPHTYFEENQLHAFILSEMKDYNRLREEVEIFLPYIDNWATCDQLRPKIYKKHREALLEDIKRWLGSDKTYTIRFAIGMLMVHFLDEDFRKEYPEWVSRIHSEEYYVNMMIAWYFATALAKQWSATLPYLEEKKLDTWVHNKTIQKARESYRITEEQKVLLKELKQ